MELSLLLSARSGFYLVNVCSVTPLVVTLVSAVRLHELLLFGIWLPQPCSHVRLPRFPLSSSPFTYAPAPPFVQKFSTLALLPKTLTFFPFHAIFNLYFYRFLAPPLNDKG